LFHILVTVKASSNDKINEPTLKREDSNLSKKSLTKLRAALAKPVMGVSGIRREPVAVARKEAEIKKDTLEVKKDVPEAKKEVTRMPSIKTSSVVTTTTSTMPTTMSLSSKRLAGIEDIDANDKENLVLVSEYVNDIYDYLYHYF